MTDYPNGYGTQKISLDQMKDWHGGKMHPEYARRFFAYIEAKDGLLGVGGGWRATQPQKPGFAPPGKSFHESQDFSSGFSGYCAVDLVCANPGGKHRAPTWEECDDAPEWGLHTFIKSPPEPWHIQPIEISGWQTWVNQGRPDPAADFALPDGSTGDAKKIRTNRPDVESGDYGSYPIDPNKPKLRSKPKSVNQHVSYLQAVLRNECGIDIEVDDHFGPKTGKAVKRMQGWNKLEVDGIVGPVTWRVIDAYATQ